MTNEVRIQAIVITGVPPTEMNDYEDSASSAE